MISASSRWTMSRLRGAAARRFSSSSSKPNTTRSSNSRRVGLATAATTGGGACLFFWSVNRDSIAWAAPGARIIPTSGDVLSVGSPVKEAATGILFPQLCNGMQLVGTGVRIKFVFVKVYAVGTYMDPIAMMGVKKGGPEVIQAALLDPTYPRTIRIVMNRGLSIDKYTAAIVEALEPRMKGQDLDKLEEFKKLNPPVDLVEGAEIEMTIRGDSLLYKNAMGGVGSLKSRVFLEALCDVYYGEDPVSPGHKEQVLEGVTKL